MSHSTVIHRAKSKKSPNVPFISTTFDGMNSNAHAVEYRHTSPSTHSSASPLSRDSKSAWSPASTSSTAATSFTSPSSSGSRKRHSPEECQNQNTRRGSNADDLLLPPIEEDNGRFLMIPVQENSTTTTKPSVMTVENAAAAKCALETLYDPVFTEPHSARSLRKKKFLKYLNELGMPHDDRMIA